MTQLSTSVPARRRWFSRAPQFAAIPPWALVLMAVISVQFGAAFAKGLFDVAGPSGVVFIRLVLTGSLFVALWRPNLRALTGKDRLWVLLYGMNTALMMMLFYAAIDRIPLGVSVAITFIGPLAVAVIGSRRALDVVWALLAGVGIVLLSPLVNDSLDPVGLAISVVCGISWALYIVIGRRVTRMADGNSLLGVSLLIAAVTVLPFGAAGAVRVLAHPELLLLALVVAFLSSMVPFALEFEALRRITPRAFGLLLSLEPVAATVVGFLILHEALGARELAGILMVTVAAAATARSE